MPLGPLTFRERHLAWSASLTKNKLPGPTHEEIEALRRAFLAAGGTITRLPPGEGTWVPEFKHRPLFTVRGKSMSMRL